MPLGRSALTSFQSSTACKLKICPDASYTSLGTAPPTHQRHTASRHIIFMYHCTVKHDGAVARRRRAGSSAALNAGVRSPLHREDTRPLTRSSPSPHASYVNARRAPMVSLQYSCTHIVTPPGPRGWHVLHVSVVVVVIDVRRRLGKARAAASACLLRPAPPPTPQCINNCKGTQIQRTRHCSVPRTRWRERGEGTRTMVAPPRNWRRTMVDACCVKAVCTACRLAVLPLPWCLHRATPMKAKGLGCSGSATRTQCCVRWTRRSSVGVGEGLRCRRTRVRAVDSACRAHPARSCFRTFSFHVVSLGGLWARYRPPGSRVWCHSVTLSNSSVCFSPRCCWRMARGQRTHSTYTVSELR